MGKNNFLALLYYFYISIISYTLSFLIDDRLYNVNKQYLNAVFQPTIILVIFSFFVLTGRYLLRNQGSKTKNLLSVSLIALLGLVDAVQDLIVPYIKLDPYVLYWAYSAPLEPLVDKLSITFASHSISAFLFWCILSIIPSVLIWLGIQWRVKSHNHGSETKESN